MEIPYVVSPRKDTGLFNSKIAIWLFLASEVMLFGGLFSGYLFLRIYADYPWPERALPIVPGLINTFILILSSITVVFAWASLKLRKWNQFRLYMLITLICAAVFMIFKVFEYKAKFEHQAVRLPDFTIVEGHVHKAKIDSKGHISHDHGKKEHAKKSNKHESYYHGYQDKLIFKSDSINFDLTKYDDGYTETLFEQAKKAGSKIILDKDVIVKESPSSEEMTIAKAGDELSLSILDQARSVLKKARASNATARTEELRRQWRVAKHENPELEDWKNASNVSVDPKLISDQLVKLQSSVSAKVEPKIAFLFKPTTVNVTETSAKRKDGTLLSGSLEPSPMALGVDSVDFTFLVQKAEERGVDPDAAIEQSWILKNNPELKKYWEMHKVHIAKLEKELEESGKEPTEYEKYRMTWKEILYYSSGGDIDLKWFNGFTGANHKKYHFPDLELPREQIAFESKFTPRWNNYYAIYFTITGLHGLHIIGGAIVLGYYMFCPNMFRTNPEWLANRVEVAGLFWHFVDLVWIFLFPILYLM